MLRRWLTVLFGSLSVSAHIMVFALSLLPIYYSIKKHNKSARDLKKLQSISNSRILNQFMSIASGTATIKAFGKTNSYREKIYDLLDDNIRSSWYLALVSRWADVRMGALGAAFVTAVSVAITLNGTTSPDAAAFAITFAMQYTKAVAGISRKAAATEGSLSVVERVKNYINIPKESESGIPAPVSWPAAGGTEVRDLLVVYDKGLPPVLKGLSFSITPRQSVKG